MYDEKLNTSHHLRVPPQKKCIIYKRKNSNFRVEKPSRITLTQWSYLSALTVNLQAWGFISVVLTLMPEPPEQRWAHSRCSVNSFWLNIHIHVYAYIYKLKFIGYIFCELCILTYILSTWSVMGQENGMNAYCLCIFVLILLMSSAVPVVSIWGHVIWYVNIYDGSICMWVVPLSSSTLTSLFSLILSSC